MTTTLQKIRWKDNQQEETVLFAIGEYEGEDDDEIFYWVESMEEIGDNNFEEFEII